MINHDQILLTVDVACMHACIVGPINIYTANDTWLACVCLNVLYGSHVK